MWVYLQFAGFDCYVQLSGSPAAKRSVGNRCSYSLDSDSHYIPKQNDRILPPKKKQENKQGEIIFRCPDLGKPAESKSTNNYLFFHAVCLYLHMSHRMQIGRRCFFFLGSFTWMGVRGNCKERGGGSIFFFFFFLITGGGSTWWRTNKKCRLISGCDMVNWKRCFLNLGVKKLNIPRS